MKSAWKNGKVHIEFVPSSFYGHTNKRLQEEWVRFKDYGPFTAFGLKSACVCGLVGSAWIGYKSGKKAIPYGDNHRKSEIGLGCVVGGVTGMVMGGIWPLVPIVGAYFVISRTIEVATRQCQ